MTLSPLYNGSAIEGARKAVERSVQAHREAQEAMDQLRNELQGRVTTAEAALDAAKAEHKEALSAALASTASAIQNHAVALEEVNECTLIAFPFETCVLP